jgi:hypothetical protein
VKRVVSTLDKIEKDLSALEEARKRYNDGVAQRLASSLGKAVERLEGLPSAEEGAAEQRARAEAFEGRIKTLVATHGSLGARSGLDSKAANKVNALDTKLGNLAQELAKFEEGRSRFNERIQGRLEGKVKALEEELERLPQDNEVVAALLERGSELRSSFQALCADLGAEQAAAAETDAAIASLLAAPEYAGDVERAKQIVELFKRGRSLFALDALHFRRLDGLLDEARDLGTSWREARAAYESLRDTYALLLENKGRWEILWPLQEAERWLPMFSEVIDDFLSGARAAVAEGIADAKAEAALAVAEQRPWQFSTYSSELRSRASFARNVATLHDLAAPGAEPLTPLADACDQDLAQEEEQLAELIVNENRAPADAYTGSDQSELEAFVRAQWSEHFPDEEVLGLRFPQEAFARTTAWRMESSQPQLTKVDHSDLWIRVLVEAGAEVISYRALISRLHLESDRLTLRWSRPDPVPPGSRILRSNL